MNLTTLEQSKKLKEWGAPQDTERSWYLNPYNVNTDFILETTSKVADVRYLERYAAYDLESLIGWLGYSFRGLATMKDLDYTAMGMDFQFQSNTPLEAVYALAEAIHQPKD